MNKLNTLFKWIFRKAVLFSAALIFISCVEKTPDQSADKILARVGGRTISVDEFINRAELTLRPPYCRGDKEIHKRIILNSLIAEKLLALEAGENNELSRDERYQLNLKGRKEQAMRQWLYKHDFYEKVQLDSTEITTAFKLAGRKYYIAYFTIKDSAVSRQVQNKLKQGLSFAEIFQQLEGQEEIPRREVSWIDNENEVIHTALFSELVKKGQVVGPIKIENNFYTLIKILGWTDRNVLSNSEVQKRLNDVKKKLKEKKAFAQFREYVKRVMRGKRIMFSKDSFYDLVKILGPFYMKMKKKNIMDFKQRYWDQDSIGYKRDEIEINLNRMQDHPLLHIDNETWTVNDFQLELISHPLVFRENKFGQSEFAEQLKLAIADLIRDKYLTKEAYKKEYDRIPKVQRDVSMWRDYYYSEYQKEKFLKSLDDKDRFNQDYMEIIKKDINPYVSRLQEKYQDKIEIDTKLFNKITLTSINLMVMQDKVPFPVVIPGFPLLTTIQELPD